MPVLKHKIGYYEVEASLMESKYGNEKTAYEIWDEALEKIFVLYNLIVQN